MILTRSGWWCGEGKGLSVLVPRQDDVFFGSP